jgi:hypothetical protein
MQNISGVISFTLQQKLSKRVEREILKFSLITQQHLLPMATQT